MLETCFSNFDPGVIDYSPYNALILAEASKLVYRSEKAIKRSVNRVWQMPEANVKFIQKKVERDLISRKGNIDTEAFLACNDQALVISFRGTEPTDTRDWKTVFNTQKYRIPLSSSRKHVNIHEGFWKALDFAWEEILAGIQQLRNCDQSIWLTGHSLGGVLATLAAFRLSQFDGIPVDGLYTFGQPGIGCSRFARVFNKAHKSKTFRFVNNNDIGANLFPQFLFGYVHVGQLFYITADDKIVRGGLPWLRYILDIVAGFGDLGISDHDIGDYIRIIAEQV